MNDNIEIKIEEQIKNLYKGNESIFLETINEILIEEWFNDEETELFTINMYSSNFVSFLKEKISKEIGEEYANNLSKFSILFTTFTNTEIIGENTDGKAREKMQNNPKILDETKEFVKNLDKRGDW